MAVFSDLRPCSFTVKLKRGHSNSLEGPMVVQQCCFVHYQYQRVIKLLFIHIVLESVFDVNKQFSDCIVVLVFIQDGTCWDKPGTDVSLSFYPGTKKFSCPGVPLSNKGSQQQMYQEKITFQKTSKKQEKVVHKQEKEVLKQEKMF